MNTLQRSIVAAILMLAVCASADATDLRYGDVIVGWNVPIVIQGPYPTGVSRLRADEPERVLVPYQITTQTPVVGTDVAGQLSVLGWGTIEKFDAGGNVVAAFPIDMQIMWPAQSLTFDRAGYLYLQGSDGLYKLDQRGNSIRRFPLAYGLPFDLAADQCTLYFIFSRGVGRYDVCTAQRLSDVTSGLNQTPWAGRVLPDGSFLLGFASSTLRIGADGSTMKSYTVGAIGLALGVDGRSFWAAPSLKNVDLDSGAVTLQLPMTTPSSVAMNIGVIGEPRAANGFSILSLPAASPATVALLALALLVAGLVAVRAG